jgi:hypothetical protein
VAGRKALLAEGNEIVRLKTHAPLFRYDEIAHRRYDV